MRKHPDSSPSLQCPILVCLVVAHWEELAGRCRLVQGWPGGLIPHIGSHVVYKAKHLSGPFLSPQWCASMPSTAWMSAFLGKPC